METTFTVLGMTCDHCIAAVTDELMHIRDVRSVTIDLASGTVTVGSAVPVDRSAIASAVDEAGYELA